MRSTLLAVALFSSCLQPDTGVTLPVELPEPTPNGFGRQVAGSAVRRAMEVTGGTVTPVGANLVAVSNPDSDEVFFVQVIGSYTMSVLTSVALPEHSLPARAAFDPAQGMLYVVLRGKGDIARIEVSTFRVAGITHACAEPRGISWDDHAKLARVACAEGQVASVDSTGRITTERWAADVRDVWANKDGQLEGTTFRAAKRIGRSGALKAALPEVNLVTMQHEHARFVPEVAWRSTVASDGTVVVVHQRAIEGPVSTIFSVPQTTTTTTTTTVTDYGGTTREVTNSTSTTTPACATPVVRAAVTMFSADEKVTSFELPGVVPVDVAVSPDATELTVALAGSKAVFRRSIVQSGFVTGQQCGQTNTPTPVGGIPSGVTYLADGTLLVHTVSPNRLLMFPRAGGNPYGVPLSPTLAPGMELFHEGSNGMACASCHPEGRDDGHVWDVRGTRRRTPSLVGGIMSTAPFHWEGELADLTAVMAETFVRRMGGKMPEPGAISEMAKWIEYLPPAAPVATLSADELELGRALFEGPQANCAACHAGPMLTDNVTRNVGTGGSFQTPSLRGVGARGPWLHDGRALTLMDRFLPYGGGDKHGGTSLLSPAELRLLVGYLETL